MNQTNSISYEASPWYVKVWRSRWYLYALFLQTLNIMNVEIWVDFIYNGNSITDEDGKKLRSSWKEIKRHVELSKMHKYTSKYERQD